MFDRTVTPAGLVPFSGQITGTADQSVVQLPIVRGERIIVRPLGSNTGIVSLGRTTGTFDRNSGMELEAADPPLLLEGLRNLNELQMHTPGGGDGVSFVVLHDPSSNPLL